MPSEVRRALVLAGRRAAVDPVAGAAGVTHKALAPVAGIPMALRVIEALAKAGAVETIGVSCADRALVVELASLAERAGIHVAIEHEQSAHSPAASVAAFVRSLSPDETALVTTADHPLLTGEIVSCFLREALARDADLVAGVVAESVYRRRFPEGPRTFIRLSDCAVSGANLFLVRAPGAARIADFWLRLEGVRKQPWRLVSHFGASTLLRFLGGWLTIGQAEKEVSRRVGASVGVVLLPFAEAALDVDRPSDLERVESVLHGGTLEKSSGAG